MNHTVKLLLALGAAAALAADTSAQGRVGSIYDAGRAPVRLVSSKIARDVGDLVTVQISENQDLKDEEKTDLSTEKSLRKALLDLNVSPGTFEVLPSLETSSTDEFAGESKIEKKKRFTARLTAQVVDVLPNGNLVLQGRREIRIDQEVKLLEFSGVVRRYDVSATNTIQSELVADALVVYVGSGPATNANRRRGFAAWLHDVVDWIWPF